MPVPKQPNPTRGRHFRSFLVLGLLCAWLVQPALARTPNTPLRIPLEPLGFQPLSPQFLLAGSSMLSLNYVDDTHLLVTFNVHRLMPRVVDDPVDDQDHNVDAVLLELPTGRVLARTSWRLHDRGQYLWSIGHGRFLLRIRDTVTVFAPLVNLASGKPFLQQPFLNTDNLRIATIDVSPDCSLLTIETVKRTPPAARQKAPLFGPNPPQPAPQYTSVQINFYRLIDPDDPSEIVRPKFAGIVRADEPGTIPVLDAGYIAVIDQGRQHWAFDFNSFSGKTQELSPFDSVCRPIPYWVSRSEFIAFGCRSGNTRQVLGGFNLRGEETWEQNLFGSYVSPSLAFASATGRFALSRVMVRSAGTSDQPLMREEIAAQTVVVYQTESGRQILRVECTPAAPAGQNFALSPNGLNLAFVHDNAIEIYQLPELTDKEAADVRLAQSAEPPQSELPVRFHQQSHVHEDSEADSAGPSLPAPAPPVESAVAPPVPETPATPEPTVANGDEQPGAQPRKRPTIYTLPTDSPHHDSNSGDNSDDRPQ